MKNVLFTLLQGKFLLLGLLLINSASVLNGQSESEPNNSFANSDPISLGASVTGSINPSGDLDFFSVQVSQAGVITVNVTNVPSNIDLNVSIYNADQQLIESEAEGNGEAVFMLELVCEPGTYYILLTDDESNAGQYNLQVELDISDIYECNNSFNAAAAIQLGTDIFASIRDHGDEDYYRFEVSQPGVIVVNVTQVPANIDLNVALYNPGQQLIESDAGGNGEQVSIIELVCEPGTYYLRLTDDESSPDQYKLQVNLDVTDAYECNNSFATAAPIDFDATIVASIRDHGDRDYYRVNVSQPGVIVVNVTNVPANIDLNVSLYDPNQNLIESDAANNGQSVTILELVCEPGSYYVLLTDDESNSGQYSLQVNLDTSDIYECNNSFATAAPIAFDTNIFASIRDHGDDDYFRFEVTEPGVIVVNVTNVPSNIDLNANLYDTNQQLIESASENNGEDVFMLELVCEPGTYYLLLTDDESSPEQYTLQVNLDTTDPYECNNSISEAAEIPCNVDVFPTLLDAGDADYFKFEVAMPGIVQVNITNVAANLDLGLVFYNQDQQIINSTNAGNGASLELNTTVSEPGIYYILVDDDESSFDPYTLHVSCPVINATQALGQGIISVYPNPVKDKLWLELTDDLNPNFQYCRLFNAQGKLVISWDQPDNVSRLSLDVAAIPAGIYFLEINTLKGRITQKVVKE